MITLLTLIDVVGAGGLDGEIAQIRVMISDRGP